MPAAAFLWILGHHGACVLLVVWCIVFVVGAEHLGKPFAMRAVLGGRDEMHTGLVFLALLGGLEMFGLLGLVVGPLVFAFLLAMLRIYERDFRTSVIQSTSGNDLSP
jgi:predicted PurR-regulated permease PerM